MPAPGVTPRQGKGCVQAAGTPSQKHACHRIHHIALPPAGHRAPTGPQPVPTQVTPSQLGRCSAGTTVARTSQANKGHEEVQ